MGQYGNQPDFITKIVKAPVEPVSAGSLTAADSLGGAVLYIGTSAAGDTLQVIPAGVVGPSTVTSLTSLGYAGSNGTGYQNDTARTTAVVSGNGDGNLSVDITQVNGVITTIVVNAPGAGYVTGDLIRILGGDENAIFRVVAPRVKLPGTAQAVTFTNLPQGEWFPVVVDYVLSDSTTVSDIIAGK